MTKASSWRAAVALAALAVAGWTLSSSTCAKAQTRRDFQLWGEFFFTGQVFHADRGPIFWLEGAARRRSIGTQPVLRPAAGYALSSWASLLVGYTWEPQFVDASSTWIKTQGVWEQATFISKASERVILESRTRFMQLWSDAGSGMSPILRQLGRVLCRPSEDVPVGLAVWDEVFFGLRSTDWADAGLFENRFFAGLAIFANKSVFRVEPGYMLLTQTQGSEKVIGQVLMINFFVNFRPK